MRTITEHFINGDFVGSHGTAVWTADAVAVLWPERRKAVVPMSG